MKYFRFFEFYGFTNPNSCLFTFYSYKNNKGYGIDILPLCFWKHFYCHLDTFFDDVKRFHFGCGLFSFFYDF